MQIEVDHPSAKVIKAWTIKMHKWMNETIENVFTLVHHMTLTKNAWTKKNGCCLLGVTVHWIDATWEYCECVLAIQELMGNSDGESMVSILLEIIDEFKLHAKVSICT